MATSQTITVTTAGHFAPPTIADAILAARVALVGLDIPAVPVRRLVSAACAAEVAHADADIDRAITACGADGMYDRYDMPGCRTSFRLPHEAAAAVALVWLSHLQAADCERRGPWARWAGMTRAEKVTWLGRRRKLVRGLIVAANRYRALRAALA